MFYPKIKQQGQVDLGLIDYFSCYLGPSYFSIILSMKGGGVRPPRPPGSAPDLASN